MRRREFLKGTIVAGVGASVAPSEIGARADESPIIPVVLRCESLENPLGIDDAHPRLSWKLEAVDDARNQIQTAYRIQVASSSELLSRGSADIWDTQKVFSGDQLHIEYGGRPLISGQRCYWQVEVWDGDDRKSIPSVISLWEMGLLKPSDWTGSWISDGTPLPKVDEGHYQDDPAPLFRRSFQVDKPVERARLYATALGYHDLRLNGEDLSDHVLDPAWTSTSERVFYTCHDLTERLREGENVLGVMLGNGWANPLPLRMWSRINIREHLPVERPRFLSELIIEYADGSEDRVASDGSWLVSKGPLLRNSVYLGESYDARREQLGWDAPGFEDSHWKAVSELSETMERCRSMPIPPIRATRTLKAESLTEISDGVYVFDFGQNFAGWARLKVEGPRGSTVQMRLGELLYEDGSLNPMTAVTGQIKGLREDGTPRGGPGAPEVAWQANTYTLRGGGPEEYSPRFTFHGFRYVEVTGFPGKPDLSSLEGLRLNTDVDSVGTFECSNERFNRIQEMVRWTFLSNLFSVQSDCPAREKFQYGGDIVASSEMAIYNYNMATFYAKAVSDFSDARVGDGWFTETAPYVGIAAANYAEGAGPIGWGLAHPLLVAQLYQYYGDIRIIEEHFEAARIWVDLLEASSVNYIIDRCIGDHESLDPKPIELIATAQFFQAATLVSEFAEILNKPLEVSHYSRLAARIKAAFIEHFLEEGTGRFGVATQAAQSTALYMGLVPDSEKRAAIQRMVDSVSLDHKGHVATGIFGTKYLLNMLSATSNNDVAYRMVDQKEFPGWGHMLENGATTLWETWAQSDNVYSQNHPMFGMVSEWFFKSLGGIEPSSRARGYDHFSIAPFMATDLDWVEAKYESVRGTISSRWKRENRKVTLHIEVPVNTTAVVRIPTSNADSLQVDGKSVSELKTVNMLAGSPAGLVEIELGSGRYQFTVAVV